MIMTSAVEARTHAVAPESIGIHFTCKQICIVFLILKLILILESGREMSWPESPCRRKNPGNIFPLNCHHSILHSSVFGSVNLHYYRKEVVFLRLKTLLFHHPPDG
jgi:hypothetical protein